MPNSLTDRDHQRKHSTPRPPGRKSPLGRHLAELLQEMEEEDTPEQEDEGVEVATMADAAKVVRDIRYLVKNWVPYGMVTGAIGAPGSGKSGYVLGAIAKPVVTGCPFFNSAKRRERGRVLWVGTEHDIAITLKRIRDWEIPSERILLPFSDPLATADLTNVEHLEQIERVIESKKPKLVVVDSLRGAHNEDENNSRVGMVLKNLAAIVERTGPACLVIHHTKKLGPDEEISSNSSRGSNAIFAMFRALIGIDQPDPTSKVCRLRMLKENLGLAPDPVGFEITPKGVKFVAVPQKPKRLNPKAKAVEWLRARMKPGKTYKSAVLIAKAVECGFDDRTLRRAATEELGIEPKPVRKGRRIVRWMWTLPLSGRQIDP